MSAHHDLVVRGGEVVGTDGRAVADVGITDGRIAQLGGPMTGTEELDARGCYVLPGGLDMHVHLAPAPATPGGYADTFESGSRAAAAGGVTTYGHMAFPDESDPADTLMAAVERDVTAASRESLVDFVVHPSVYLASPDLLEALPVLAERGHRSFKVVTIAFDDEPAGIIEAIDLAGSLGMLTLVHCEDGLLIDHITAGLVASGKRSVAHYPASRPDFTESVAVERAAAICEATGAPVCIMHLSSRRALSVATDARTRGLPVFVETRPVYLHQTDEVYQRPDPAAYVGMPPQRTAEDQAALWRALSDGRIQTVASDHAPWLLADKLDPELDVATCRKGFAELETMIPMLFSEGVLTGRISLERLVAATSTTAARLYGLHQRKGRMAVGLDADLTVLDPRLSRVIDARTMQSGADYCVYDGTTVTGWPRFTLSRGEVVVREGDVLDAPGRGVMVPQVDLELG